MDPLLLGAILVIAVTTVFYFWLCATASEELAESEMEAEQSRCEIGD